MRKLLNVVGLNIATLNVVPVNYEAYSPLYGGSDSPIIPGEYFQFDVTPLDSGYQLIS